MKGVVRAGTQELQVVSASGVAHGLRTAVLLGPANGSVHMEIAISELEPGGRVEGHVHPFEESFFILDGRALFTVAGLDYELVTHDFGLVPLAHPHAWSNPFDEPVRWLRVRAPQPKRIGNSEGTYPVPDVPLPVRGRRVDERQVTSCYVGHFADHDLPPPGPLSMPGYHGPNVTNVSIRMLVDSLLGARHHTLFMVEFEPLATRRLTAKEHFHPFEEMYYYLRGQSRGWLDGEQYDIGQGDLVFTGVNVSHGFLNSGDSPVRWLEVQAPMPPESGGFLFDDDWKALEPAAPQRR